MEDQPKPEEDEAASAVEAGELARPRRGVALPSSAAIRRGIALLLATLLAACGSTAMPTVSPSAAPSWAATASFTAIAAVLPGAASPASSAPASAETAGDQDDDATPGGPPVPSPAATTDPTATAARQLPGEPDPDLTPGAINPAVTQATIGATICVSGWTATIRPSTSYTTPLKIRQISEYGYADTSTASYEEDHLIPLELGGAPSDPANLWPEPYTATTADGRDVGARVKDSLENSLKKAVCAGTLSLSDAQARIGIHWVHVFYGIPLTADLAPPVAPPVPPAGTAAPPVLPPASFGVAFVSLPNPAIHGSTANMAARTTAGAVCSAKVTWPSGAVSTAAGLQTTPTAGADGLVSWAWNVGSTTKPGTAKAVVTCTLGSVATASDTFAVQ